MAYKPFELKKGEKFDLNKFKHHLATEIREAGKGARPRGVNKRLFDAQYERIFGHK